MTAADAPSEHELQAAHCWEAGDRVPGRPEMTAFRHRVRLQQARWREAQGYPIGSQPIGTPRKGTSPRPVGSRIPLEYARETGANFVTAAALDAVKARVAAKEREQSLDLQRLWADLLSSVTLAFNLFGDLAHDLELADRAVHTWWPDAPGKVTAVRFAHSPGRLDPSYVGSLSDWDVAFVLDRDDGTQGVIGVDTTYHECLHPEVPKPIRLARYLEVTDRSGAFASKPTDAVNGKELTVMWLEHLLVLSMLQHPSDAWSWGRYVVVHPGGNSDFAAACARYRALLADSSTFASLTVEELLDHRALPPSTTKALRDRYV